MRVSIRNIRKERSAGFARRDMWIGGSFSGRGPCIETERGYPADWPEHPHLIHAAMLRSGFHCSMPGSCPRRAPFASNSWLVIRM